MGNVEAQDGTLTRLGHAPGPIRISTSIETSADAARRWREQYKDWNDEDTFADGTPKSAINDALNRCRHTPENISRVLNEGWARPECDCCGGRHDAVAAFARPWGDSTWSLCGSCLDHARAALKAAEQST